MRSVIFIFKGKLRKTILKGLEGKPKTGKSLSKELGKHLTSVSRTLIELEKKKFIRCLNPKDDRFRFYQLTQKGRQALKRISEMEN